MKQFLLSGLAGALALLAPEALAQAQATLGTSPYVETFDNLASGLPAGFVVYTAASSGALGTAAALAPAPALWNATNAGFKNFASATGMLATATAAEQTAAPNRALGVRQTGTAGYDPGAAFVFQAANTAGKTDLSLTFRLQSLDNATAPRTTSWQVDYAVGAAPTAFMPVGTGVATGANLFTSNAVTVSFGSTLDDVAGPVWIRVIALTASTGSGNRPSTAIDDFTLRWASNPSAPVLTATPAVLAFGNQPLNLSSAAQTYTLSAANLTAGATLTTAEPFSISKDGTVYTTILNYSAADLAAAKTVSVRFTPTAPGPATGTVVNTSAGATARTVVLTGTGINPNQIVFNFNGCTGSTTLSDGFTQVSVVGPQVWGCTTFGRDPNAPAGTTAFPSGVQINGFANGTNVTNEDWLVSPPLNLTNSTFPLLSYWSRTAFNGPALRLLASTNYPGTGSPTAAGVTWTDLNAAFPAPGTDRWTQTQNVDLSAYKTAGVYVAFVYNSTTDEGARWTLDDVVLTNSATAPPPTLAASARGLSFGYQAVGTSAVQTLRVSAANLTGPLTVVSSDPAFQLSKDGTAFSPSLSYPAADAAGKTLAVQVRFSPAAAATAYAATATVAAAGAPTAAVALSGNTYDVAGTLEVVNWNMEWFGSPAAGLGPPDKNLQAANAAAVFRGLNADVYALQEVVDTVRLRALVSALPGYAYRVAYFGSNADDSLDADYAGAQKLAFVYRTAVVSNPKFSAFFRSKAAQNLPDYSYWSSGRFPFVMQADVVLNGVRKPVTFVAIHAKANTSPTATSYARRKSAADELKAKLDADYAGRDFVVLGDFNDDLDQTVTAGVAPPTTSYSAFTADAANYPSPTLQELSLTGKQSTVAYNDVIDHVITSKSFYNSYLKGTAEVQTGIAGIIANYGTTTSDHYPVLTRYAFGTVTGTRPRAAAPLALYPNPAGPAVRLEVPEAGAHLRLQVHTATGRLVLDGQGTAAQLNQQLNQRLGGLVPGVYLVQVVGAQQTYVSRLLKQ
ncbi:T9SS-dependent choice-of-anchor J family protein [Hymenobacter nivis]|uniref:T9SS C-terminal target domain-containing protein n=1 Tax=Hymenobacter nivis TaxID=1850093 RepID=A0A502GZ48_9BACT|nr:choice-of-anchor J domain-containing protein [Hymenobacter nivis]TPG66578.1 T9SS C-terminal target domain-containing protein [Hymenobacter nivis]